MDNELKCPICGEPTSTYMGNARKDRLCRKHGEMKRKNLIEQCPQCGKWHETDKPCDCQKHAANDAERTDNNEITCIICGKPSNGKHFCYDCYKKYKDKDVLIKVHKCEFPTGEPLDESYEGVHECDDGHIVKSISEQVIDDWLFDKGIAHAYEVPLDIGEEKPLKPDFCLKNYLGKDNHVYIEYFGLKGQPKYDEQVKYKMNHYRRLKITLVCLYPKDGKNLKFTLQTKLNKDRIKINEINFEET